MLRNKVLVLICTCVIACLSQTSASAEDRSYDGSGNNLANSTWGAAGTQLYLVGGELNGVPTTNNLSYQAIYLINFPVVR